MLNQVLILYISLIANGALGALALAFYLKAREYRKEWNKVYGDTLYYYSRLLDCHVDNAELREELKTCKKELENVKSSK